VQRLLGGWAILASPIAVESLGRAGFDFVGVDVQHGTFGFEGATRAIQLLDVMGVPCYVRISAGELSFAPRYLDFGVTGLIVATVDDAETARQAVAIARYQPEGIRSYGGQRFGLHPEPPSPGEVRPEVWVMIETLPGAAALAEIARTPGLSGMYVGPADLALAHGVKPGTGPGSDAWRSTVGEMLELARSEGIGSGTFAHDGAQARELFEVGFDRVVVSSDVGILRAALAREVACARGLDPDLADVDFEV
jgi:4-hydroxy-2-oxoheptanedioate aldolase